MTHSSDLPVTPLPLVALICGYKRTGKDTFADELSKGNYEHVRAVYARRPHASKEHNAMIFENAFLGAERITFAGSIRSLVSEILQLPEDSEFLTDRKDEIFTEDGETVRDVMIRIGNEGRKRDPEVWAKKMISEMRRRGWERRFVCSDWRFKNELIAMRREVANVITFRVFRHSVPIPPSDVTSEHDLNDVDVDFVVLGDDGASSEKAISDVFDGFRKTYEKIGVLGANGFTEES